MSLPNIYEDIMNKVRILYSSIYLLLPLTTKWKFDLSDKIEQDFFKAMSVPVLLYELDFNKIQREKVGWELNRDVPCCFEQIPEAAP